MDGFVMNREFTINGIKCKYCGKVWVEDNQGNRYLCACIEVDNLGGIESWDQPISGQYSYDLLEKYGLHYTDYGKELVRKSGRGGTPLTFADGRMTHTIQRNDFKTEYQHVYDAKRASGGGYVMMSPLLSTLYSFGGIFNK